MTSIISHKLDRHIHVGPKLEQIPNKSYSPDEKSTSLKLDIDTYCILGATPHRRGITVNSCAVLFFVQLEVAPT